MDQSTPTFINQQFCRKFQDITPIQNSQSAALKSVAKRKICLGSSAAKKKQKKKKPDKTQEIENIKSFIGDLFLTDDEFDIFEEKKTETSTECPKENESMTLSRFESTGFTQEANDSEDIFLPPKNSDERFENDSLLLEALNVELDNPPPAKHTNKNFPSDSLLAKNIPAENDSLLAEVPNDIMDDEFAGLSQLFNESANKTQLSREEDLANKLKTKLIQNASTSVVPAVNTSTGFSQLQDNFNESFSLANSQFHELGPYFGLPSKAKELIEKHKGITELYDWQKECLNLPAIKQRNNLVYALPTSGGKTLVAEILILREVLCYKRNVLFVLPFVAIVQEKVRSLSPLAVDLGFLVEEYAAGKGTLPPRKRRRRHSVYVCTIEKALAVVQSLIENNRLAEIGLVVVDELHLLSEGSGRGATLESLITYLIHLKGEKIHIVGMSATIGNLNEVASFLEAETYTGDFRPVELTEYVKCEANVYKVDWRAEDAMVPFRVLTSPFPAHDPDGIAALVEEVCPTESVLVFCPTKKNCENVAALICKHFSKDFLSYREAEKKSLVETLTSEFNGRMCPVLRDSLRYGVAYHHSGLTADERKLLEDAYREGVICCICCTSTLAAGVNLPAKRVILRAPYVGRDFINLSKYKQMVGRAGRAGLGAVGESFLICQLKDATKVGELLRSKMDDSVSALTAEDCKDLVLSVVGLGVAITRGTIRDFLKKTLLQVQSERKKVDLKKITDDCLAALYKSGALKIRGEEAKDSVKPSDDAKNDSTAETSKLDVSVARPPESKKPKRMVRITNSAELCVSRLGRAAMKGCMSLPVALKLYGDLIKAESSLVLLCSLHLLYLVTPYQIPDHVSPNFSLFFDVYMQLGPKEQHAAKVIGLTEHHVSRMGMGQKPKNIPTDVLNRFYITLILNELWKHQSVWEVANLFQVPRGLVQNLMSSASSFSWNVLRFCEELEELWCIKAILTEFTPRLAHCCEAELLPLMDLPAIKRVRARQLFNAGYKNLQDIAKADPNGLTAAVSHLPTRAANQIIAAAKLQLLEKVENLKEEAEDVLEDIGEDQLKNLP